MFRRSGIVLVVISTIAFSVSLSLSLSTGAALAQPDAGSKAPPTGPGDPGNHAQAAAPDSPRASMEAFVDLCEHERFEEAARFLVFPARTADADKPAITKRLWSILQSRVFIDLDRISPEPRGNRADELPADTDELGRIPGPSGQSEAIYIVRRSTPDGARWSFSENTVERVDEWYAGLGRLWLTEHMPKTLLQPGPWDILWWQWLALPILLVLAWAGGFGLGFFTRGVFVRLVSKTETTWDDVLLDRLSSPLTFFWTLAILWVLLPQLGLRAEAAGILGSTVRSGLYLVFFWSLLRSVDILGKVIANSDAVEDNAVSRSILPIAMKAGKACVFAVGAVAVLAQFGYPVASLLAGLGLGGLAFALAAQKTVENVFGSLSIGVDQPFRVGDYVKIEGVLGTVETIGLRSTRVRTMDRTLVTIPNGQLADKTIETFALRDRIRLACTIGLVYGTSAAQLREVMGGIEKLLREHPKIWPDRIVVRFTGFGASSLDIEIMAWFLTQDWHEFLAIRDGINLGIMEVVEGCGSSFAFPTRTIHIVEERPAPPRVDTPAKTGL